MNESGRELDAFIAEKVMGWTQEEMWGINDYRSDGTPVMMPNFPHYSDDMAAAWEVVETLCPSANKTEPWFNLYNSNGMWHCDFHRGAAEAVAPTAPLAICEAARASKRVK